MVVKIHTTTPEVEHSAWNMVGKEDKPASFWDGLFFGGEMLVLGSVNLTK